MVSCPSATPYVEAAEESFETAFQALEIEDNAYVETFSMRPDFSDASMMVARVMLKNGYEPGMGLGRHGDGMVNLLEVVGNRGRFGLGYKPTSADKRRIALEWKERSFALLQGREPRAVRIPICHISDSFRSAGWVYADQVAMLKEDTDDDLPSWVRPCPPGFALKN